VVIGLKRVSLEYSIVRVALPTQLIGMSFQFGHLEGVQNCLVKIRQGLLCQERREMQKLRQMYLSKVRVLHISENPK